MTEGRSWFGAGLIFVGLGAAMFIGSGVALADADASDSADSSSSSTENSSSAGSDSSGESGGHRAGVAEESDTSNDPETVASFTLRRTADDDVADDVVDDDIAADEDAAADGDDDEVATADELSVTDDVTAEDVSAAEELSVVVDDDVAVDDSEASAEVTGASSGGGDGTGGTAVEPVAQRASASSVSAEASAVVAVEPGAAVEPVVADPTAAVAVGNAAGVDTVTGVQTGHSKLVIPVGHGYTTGADWYLPTQADGSVSATGVIWLQHGFLNRKIFVSALAETLSQQTNSIVVAPNVASFPWRCSGCWLNGVPMQEAVASMFLGDREALNSSANAAGYLGMLPQDFVLSGQSAGGGFATAVGGYYADDPGNEASLRGVVMFDGVSLSGVVPAALQKLDDPYIPVYQVAAPPQLWNSFGATTNELVAARPGEFVGATLARGSHADALLGGNPIVDFFAQLVTKFSPPGNTAAAHTLATGWINDLYQGLGPIDGTGIYGAPDQYIVMGDTAAVVLSPPPVVDLDDYLGTWYEVGSVKQFFSIGLVNTKAVYSPNPDGSIKVENSGNYFFNNGPESSIVGSALPVDPDNNKLNVSFFFPATDHPPGNYWIVDLSPGYSELDPDGWAIVSDSTGLSGFLLSRSQIVSDQLYQELLDRASVKGVRGWITPTRQPGATDTLAA